MSKVELIIGAESWLPLGGRLENHSYVNRDAPSPPSPTVPDLLWCSLSINQHVLEGVYYLVVPGPSSSFRKENNKWFSISISSFWKSFAVINITSPTEKWR